MVYEWYHNSLFNKKNQNYDSPWGFHPFSMISTCSSKAFLLLSGSESPPALLGAPRQRTQGQSQLCSSSCVLGKVTLSYLPHILDKSWDHLSYSRGVLTVLVHSCRRSLSHGKWRLLLPTSWDHGISQIWGSISLGLWRLVSSLVSQFSPDLNLEPQLTPTPWTPLLTWSFPHFWVLIPTPSEILNSADLQETLSDMFSLSRNKWSTHPGPMMH